MKHNFYLLLLLLLLANFASAEQNKPAQLKSYTPSQINEIYERATKNTLANDPDFFKRNIKPLAKKTSNSIGDTTSFYAIDQTTDTYIFYKIQAVLLGKSKNAQVWVEIASLESGIVNISDVDTLLQYFEESTPMTSIDPSKGIFDIDTTYFGTPPNFDGDSITDFLILDIRDGYGENGSVEYIGGYFTSYDQQPSAEGIASNARDMLYLDAYPSIQANALLPTVSHEFQHLVHYHYDQNEASWLKEAMAMLAETYCGFGVYNPQRFLSNPDNNISEFSDVIDYSQANLISLYAVEQYGSQFIKNLAQCPENDIPSIDVVMSEMNIQSSSVELIKDWLVCNYINDTSVNPKWGYQHSDMEGLRVTIEKVITKYPESYAGKYLYPVAANYFKFIDAEILSLQFNSDYAFAKLIRYYDNGDVNVTELSPGEIYTDYEFGDGVSESVMVVSTLLDYTDFNFTATSVIRDSSTIELAYDDGVPVKYIPTSSNGFGWANRFELPNNKKWIPISMKIFSGVANGSCNFHIWSSLDGKPDSDLMTPIPITLINGWNEIAIPEENSHSLPQTFFMGIMYNDESLFNIGIDSTTSENKTYQIKKEDEAYSSYELSSINDGEYIGYNMMIRTIIHTDSTTGVEEQELAPMAENYSLSQNYPNPFNPTTTITFNLPNVADVKLTVYDINGREIETLINDHRDMGNYNVVWDAGNVASGVYFYRLEAGDFYQVRKMLLIK